MCIIDCHAIHILWEWGFSTQYAFHEYCKVQAREASLVGYCINTSDLYKSHFTSTGLHPCSLDVALLCRPITRCKDREVSQQCASSTKLRMEKYNSFECFPGLNRPSFSFTTTGLSTVTFYLLSQFPMEQEAFTWTICLDQICMDPSEFRKRQVTTEIISSRIKNARKKSSVCAKKLPSVANNGGKWGTKVASALT